MSLLTGAEVEETAEAVPSFDWRESRWGDGCGDVPGEVIGDVITTQRSGSYDVIYDLMSLPGTWSVFSGRPPMREPGLLPPLVAPSL